MKRLGTDLALPILAGESNSVIAFGKVTPSAEIKVTDTAYLVDESLTHLQTGDSITRSNGSKAVLVQPPSSR